MGRAGLGRAGQGAWSGAAPVCPGEWTARAYPHARVLRCSVQIRERGKRGVGGWGLGRVGLRRVGGLWFGGLGVLGIGPHLGVLVVGAWSLAAASEKRGTDVERATGSPVRWCNRWEPVGAGHRWEPMELRACARRERESSSFYNGLLRNDP